MTQNSRRGAVLILVAGVAGLMVALSVAFLTRMRSDAEENMLIVREAQARIMLTAACSYIQEASRLGYDKGNHEEAFGWVDVRDGHLGPKLADASGLIEGLNQDDPASRWPLGEARRFPMYVMKRPPWATKLTASYNPISQDPTDPKFGIPYLSNHDPEPVASNWADFKTGDLTPRGNSLNLSWFRIKRVNGTGYAPNSPTDASRPNLGRPNGARFLVTCGAGASQGFKDWKEVTSTPGAAAMFGSQQLFEAIKGAETRLWYEVEWCASVGGASYQNLDNENGPEHYQHRPINTSGESNGGRSQAQPRNLVGTIRWIQRLVAPPDSYNPPLDY